MGTLAQKKERRVCLIEARKDFEKGDYPGICSAIWGCSDKTHNVREYLTKYISRVLKSNIYLEGWLNDKGIRIYYNLEDIKKLKKTRLAWLDWMIACYDEDIAKLERRSVVAKGKKK